MCSLFVERGVTHSALFAKQRNEPCATAGSPMLDKKDASIGSSNEEANSDVLRRDKKSNKILASNCINSILNTIERCYYLH